MILRCHRMERIGLRQALDHENTKARLTPNDALGLLYSPEKCLLLRYSANRQLVDRSLAAVRLETVFEARVFGKDAELRWLHEGGGVGTAVLLWDEAIGERAPGPDDVVVEGEPLPRTYLLWGEGTGKTYDGGWSQLAAARVGALDVPRDGVPVGSHVFLKAREYAALLEDGDGNVYVAEERLLGLEVW